MLILGYRQFYNTPGHADKLSYHTNKWYSICLHGLVCYGTDDI